MRAIDSAAIVALVALVLLLDIETALAVRLPVGSGSSGSHASRKNLATGQGKARGESSESSAASLFAQLLVAASDPSNSAKSESSAVSESSASLQDDPVFQKLKDDKKTRLAQRNSLSMNEYVALAKTDNGDNVFEASDGVRIALGGSADGNAGSTAEVIAMASSESSSSSNAQVLAMLEEKATSTSTGSSGDIKCDFFYTRTATTAKLQNSPWDPDSDSRGWTAYGIGLGASAVTLASRECTEDSTCSCFADSSSASEARTGELRQYANLICADKTGTRVSKPANCKVRFIAQANYIGNVEASTENGMTCIFMSSVIEAYATHEAVFDLNGNNKFAKAVTVKTGNQVTSSFSYELAVGAGMSKEKGAAADIGVKFGHSESSVNDFGTRRDDIACDADGTINEDEMRATLRGRAVSTVNGGRRAWGDSSSRSKSEALWWVAVTENCPGTPSTAGWFIAATDNSLLDQLSQSAAAFINSNGVTVQHVGGSSPSKPFTSSALKH